MEIYHIVSNEELDTLCGHVLTSENWITIEDQKWDPMDDTCAKCVNKIPRRSEEEE